MQNNILKARKDKGLSQADLAKRIGVTRQSISLYENNSREPKIDTWQKLSNVLGVSMPYLMGEKTAEFYLSTANYVYECLLKSDDVSAHQKKALEYFKGEDRKALLIDVIQHAMQTPAFKESKGESLLSHPSMYLWISILSEATDRYEDAVKTNENIIYKALYKVSELDTLVEEYANLHDEELQLEDLNVLDVYQEGGVSDDLLDEIKRLSNKLKAELESLLTKYPNERQHVVETLLVTPNKNGKIDTSDKSKTLIPAAIIDNGKVKHKKTWMTDDQEMRMWLKYAIRHLPNMDNEDYANSPQGKKALKKLFKNLTGRELVFK